MARAMFIAAALLMATGASAAPMKMDRKSDALEFTYEWPAEAAAIPELDRRFHADAAKAYRRYLALGRVDKQLYRRQQRGTVTDFYSKKWSTAGETAQFLSLQYVLSTYTGGAHPNTSYGALLWNRRSARPISTEALFRQPGSFAALTRQAYCHALDRERAKRRQGEQLGGDFDQCPPFSDLAIAPLDKNKDGRFETIDFVASPYTAGPYSEGEYELELPISLQLIAAIKPAYRRSFEPQRQ